MSVSPSAHVIQDAPPQRILDKWNFDIPGFGTPMLAMSIPFVHSFNPVNWWIFEKYDGVRGIWNSASRILYSRWGTPINIPNYIRCTFPSNYWLDGEVWFGRKKGTQKHAIKVAAANNLYAIAWSAFSFMVFDVPNQELLKKVFETRFRVLGSALSKDHPYIKLAWYQQCERPAQVEEIFTHIHTHAGEGVILRDPKAMYLHGYSRHLYKYKGFLDAEGLVMRKLDKDKVLVRVPKVQILHNQGIKSTPTKPIDTQEYFEMEMAVDKEFDRDLDEIAVGSFVSFRYSSESNFGGPPLNPKIYSTRNDIKTWEQLLHKKHRSPITQRVWKPPSIKSDWAEHSHRRAFFDNFAALKNFDPLVASNWYNITVEDIHKKGGSGLLSHNYGNSLAKALADVYPSTEWQPYKFKNIPNRYWENKSNRVDFLNDFSEQNKFDPLVATNWYLISKTQIKKQKGGSSFLKHYNNSICQAITDCFPFIGLDTQLFKK